MQPLRYSINVTLDGCYDHHEGSWTKTCTVTRPRTSPKRRSSLWPGNLRNDGVSVAAVDADDDDA